MEFSKYQTQIIEWAKLGKGHGCCNAVAGSGKSTTLRIVAKELEASGVAPADIKICVFGKANAQDLISKFGKAWESSISTIHSAGWSLVKNHLGLKNAGALIKNNKYKAIAQDLGLITRGQNTGRLKTKGAISKENNFLTLIDLVRLTNSAEELKPETVKDICKHFELEVWDYSCVADAIWDILDEGELLAQKGKSFDFCDQIWLPVHWELGKKQWFKPYKYVLVDECQDLNAAQLELVLSLAGTDGRILAVGDPRQAIMGFAGADNKSYSKIVERLQAKELPLSICYRCPKKHIDLVKWNFPEIPIEAHQEASEGKIHKIKENDLWATEFDGFTQVPKDSNLREDDMVICRKTAPLVSLCIKLIARGVPATVKGRAIGEQIKGDLQEIGKMPGFRYDNFNDAVNAYRLAKQKRYQGLDNEEQLVEALNDKLEALQTIYKSQPQATAIVHLEAYIDELFSDEKSPITLSTCHRAKGLEGERIFIIKPEDLPMSWRDQQDWQAEQEDNLLYVALTRSKSELYIVGDPNWYYEDEPETINTLESDSTIKPVLTTNPLQLSLGLQLDLEEKQDKLRQTLLNPEYQGMSNNMIAQMCGVSAPTVNKHRKRLQAEGLLPEVLERTDKKGRKVSTGNIGPKPKTTREKILEMAETLSPKEIEELIKELKELTFSDIQSAL